MALVSGSAPPGTREDSFMDLLFIHLIALDYIHEYIKLLIKIHNAFQANPADGEVR